MKEGREAIALQRLKKSVKMQYVELVWIWIQKKIVEQTLR